ncbi:MAG: acetate--CoA ligase family protein [Alphaproteobacteria bacterium]|nr:acetate--CoA ligase family protein [Alphaproteobacteria bacterium]
MTSPPAGGGLLGPLFSPSSVAFYGASNDPAKMAGRPFHFLLKHGFEGRAYPINRNRDTVLGRRAYPDLAALPETPEHVFVLLPTEAVETALEECAAAGVRVATVFAGGYAETGPEGAARQRRLVEIARPAGMRLVGPNCLGMINPHRKLALSAANVLELDRLIPGNITVISQSGSLTGTILSRGRDLEIGFAKLISVGNEADLTLGEIGLACIEDPATELFLLFLETLRERDRIAAFARAAHAAGKPVVVYKLGRSEAGRTATLSHTGALVGPDEAVEAFFAAHGLLRVDLFETLLDIAPLVAGRRPPAMSLARRGAGVSVITTTGGGGAMVVDRLGSQGLRLVGPSDETARRCRAKGISVQPSTMVDLTAAGIRHDIVHDAIDSVLANPDADAVVMVAGSTAQFYPHLAVDPIVDFAGSDKPLAAYIVPPAEDSRRLLIAAGIAAFRSPEAAADAIAALFRWRAPRAAAESADAAAAPAALARIRGRADEMQALTVFAALGIEAAASAIVDPGAAPSIDFGYPVAVKALAAELAHKSDAGGVLLDVGGAEALGAAIAEIRDNLGRRDPGLARASILVQRMESGVAEALVGFVRDAQAGPVVTVGVGGIDAELHDDTAVRLAPVSLAEAREMIEEVRGLTVLSGLRGRPRGDAEALARAVVAMSSLALAAPRVAEAEINPLIVRREGSGAVAVDGLLRLMEA